jgi:hypothetical protein
MLEVHTISIEGFIKPLILKRKGSRGGKSLTFLVKRVEGPSSLALLKSRRQRRYSRQRRLKRSKKRIYKLRERPRKQQRFRHGRSYERH